MLVFRLVEEAILCAVPSVLSFHRFLRERILWTLLCQKWLSTPWVRREPLLCSIPRSPVTCGKYSVTWLKVCVNSCLILQIVYLRFCIHCCLVVWRSTFSLEHLLRALLHPQHWLNIFTPFSALCAFAQLDCSFKSNHKFRWHSFSRCSLCSSFCFSNNQH